MESTPHYSARYERKYRGGNLGYKPRYKEGYFPVPPHDTLQDIRSEIVLALMQAGVQVEVHHHEVATAGQNEIDMRFAPLTRMADNVMMYKYFCKNIARGHGKWRLSCPNRFLLTMRVECIATKACGKTRKTFSMTQRAMR